MVNGHNSAYTASSCTVAVKVELQYIIDCVINLYMKIVNQ